MPSNFQNIVFNRDSLGSQHRSSISSVNENAFQSRLSQYQNFNQHKDVPPKNEYPSSVKKVENSAYQNRNSIRIPQLQPQRSVRSKYSNIKSTVERKQALNKWKYINQLAQLQYEEKQEEIHTKYTKASQATLAKKLKAKNQIAEFIEEEEQQNQGFQELMNFKHGGDEPFHFQAQKAYSYEFCLKCDQIHNDHPQVHSKICASKVEDFPQLYTPGHQKYPVQSLARICKNLKKISSTEGQQLLKFSYKVKQAKQSNVRISSVERQIDQLKLMCQRDQILNGVLLKIVSFL